MTENIQEQITLLETTKDENRIAIMEKGVMVYNSDLYSTYPTRISQISMTAGDKDDVLKAIIDRSITSINIPYGISEIKEQCFNGCSLLEEVTIPDTVKTIGNNAFNYCTSLTSITIPASVETLVGCTFCDTGLTSITFLSETPADLQGTSLTGNYPIYVPADSVDTYKSAWSAYASRIQEAPSNIKGRVHFQDGTTSDIPLNNDSILYATELAGLNSNENPIVGLDVSNRCTKIMKGNGNNDTFWYLAPNLSWVKAANTVTSIGESTFDGLNSITSLDDIQLPGVTMYPNYAFQGCFYLIDANIPEGVSLVQTSCFYHCQSITSLHIPSTLTQFNDDIEKSYGTPYSRLTSITVDANNTKFTAINNCLIQYPTSTGGNTKLLIGCPASVIPDNIPNLVIWNNAFANNAELASGGYGNFTVPTNVITIGQNAFGFAKSVTMLSSTPCTLYSGAFTVSGYTLTYPIYVPTGSLDTYLANSDWAVYKDRLFEYGVAKWTEQSFECELDATDTKTGMVTVVEKDTNPTSSTYNQTRTRTYEDLSRCNPSTGFSKITSLDEATTGKYLIVDTSAQIALNASLIKNTTTSTNGINGTNNVNTINVTITDDIIEANETTLNAAVDYDATNHCLTWTDPDTQQLYYIQWKTSTTFAYDQERFTKNGYNVSPKTVNNNFSFWSGSGVRTMGKHNSYNLIRFYSENNSAYYTNIALFKLS